MLQQVAKSGFNYSDETNFLEFKGFRSLTDRVEVLILIIIQREMTLDHRSALLAKNHFINSRQNSTDCCPPDLPMNSPDKTEVRPSLIFSHVLLSSLTVRFYPDTDNSQDTPRGAETQTETTNEQAASDNVQITCVCHGKRIFHLGADVFQAVGELDGVLFLVLVEHLQLDVQLLRLFELLRREGRQRAEELETRTCKSPSRDADCGQRLLFAKS